MFSVETNKAKRLLVISAAGHVSKEEVKHAAEQVREALQDAAPGSRVLTDFRWLESMRPGAAPHIAEIMDALAEKQVASVIRIIPDPGKDIGMNILSQFRYSRKLPISTVETLVDALDRLFRLTSAQTGKPSKSRTHSSVVRLCGRNLAALEAGPERSRTGSPGLRLLTHQ